MTFDYYLEKLVDIGHVKSAVAEFLNINPGTIGTYGDLGGNFDENSEAFMQYRTTFLGFRTNIDVGAHEITSKVDRNKLAHSLASAFSTKVFVDDDDNTGLLFYPDGRELIVNYSFDDGYADVKYTKD